MKKVHYTKVNLIFSQVILLSDSVVCEKEIACSTAHHLPIL